MKTKIVQKYNYLITLLQFLIGRNKIQIIGLDQEQYPFLTDIIKKYLKLYKLNKIRVIIKEKGFNAHTFSFLGDRIIISRKIFIEMNEGEIEAIVAHEFAHAYYRDFFLCFILRLIFILPFLCLFLLSYANQNNAFYAFLMIFSFLLFIFGLRIINWIIFEFEILCDRDAILTIKNPNDMEMALFKLYNHHRGIDKRLSHCRKIGQGFDYLIRYFVGITHPFLKERIENIRFSKEIRNKIESTQTD